MTLLEILYRKQAWIGSIGCNVKVTRVNNMIVETFLIIAVGESPTSKEIYAIGFLNDKPFFTTLNTTEFVIASENL